MPRPIQTRKDVSNYAPDRVRDPVSVRVEQSQRVRGPRANTREIDQFVNNLGRFAYQRVAEENAELAIQGEADALAGEVNDELMGRKSYATAVNTALGGADGLATRVEVLEQAKRDFEMAVAEGREWDANEFFENATAEFRSNPAFEDSYYARSAGQQLEALRGQLLQFGESARIKAEVEQGSTAVAKLAFAQLKAGQYDPSVSKAYADEIGLTNQEHDQAVVAGALSLLDQVSTPEQLEAVKGYMDSLPTGQQALFGDKLATSYRTAKARLEAGKTKEKAAVTEQFATLRAQIDREIDDGEMTHSRLEQLRDQNPGLFEDGEFKSRAIKIQAKAFELREEAQMEGENIATMSNPSIYFTEWDSKRQNEHKEWWMNTVAADGNRILGIVSQFENPGADPAAVREELYAAVSDARSRLEGGQQFNYTPPFVSQYLSRAANPGVANMAGAAELAGVLKDTLGYNILRDVPEAAVANLEAFQTLTTTLGMSNEQATAVMTQERGGMDYARARKVVTKNEAFGDALEDFEDSRSYIAAGDTIEALAGYMYLYSGDPKGAVEWATDYFKSTHEKLDGYYVPTRHLVPGFTQSYEDNKRDFRQYLIEKDYIAPGEDFALAPTQAAGATGEFLIMSGGLPLADDNGMPLVVTSGEFMAAASAIQDVKETRQDEIELERNQKARNAEAEGAETPMGVVGIFSPPPSAQKSMGPGWKEVLDAMFTHGGRYRESKVVEAVAADQPQYRDIIKQLHEHEGYRTKVYKDSRGFLTVGIGHKVLPEDGLKEGDLISPEKVEELFRKDFASAMEGARRLPVDFDALPNRVQRALVNMVFQMGEAGVRKFKNTLAFINAKQYDKAADEALDSLWAEQTPRRAREVTNLLRSS